MLYILGLELTTPAVAQVLIQLAPVLMGLGGIWLFGERYSTSQWMGFAVLVTGLVVFFRNQLEAFAASAGELWQGSFAHNDRSGGVGGLCDGSETTAQRLFFRRHHGLHLRFRDDSDLPGHRAMTLLGLVPAAWPILLYCALNTLIAYSSFAEALNHWEASRVGAVLALTPLGTLVFAATVERFYPGALPSERLGWVSLVGAGLVVVGSVLTSLTGRNAGPDGVVQPVRGDAGS